MNTFDLSLLVKNPVTSLKIKCMQKTKLILAILLFPVLFVFIIIGSGVEDDTITPFQIAAYFAMLAYILFYFGFLLYAKLYLDRARKIQSLDSVDEVDKHYISLNTKYDMLCKKQMFVVWVSVAIGAIGVVACVIDILSQSENIGALGIAGIIIALGAILTPPIYSAVKTIKFAQTVTTEIEGIKAYVCVAQGITPEQFAKKSGAANLNVYEANKMLKCIFDDEALRKKTTSLSFLLLMPSLICGVLVGLAISLPELGVNVIAIMLSIGGIILGLALTIYFILYQKILSKQLAIYNAQPERFADHLEFAAHHKKFRKVNSLWLIPSIVSAVAAGVLVWFLSSGAENQILLTGIISAFVFLAVALGGSIVQGKAFTKSVKHLIEKINAPKIEKDEEVFSEVSVEFAEESAEDNK